MYVILFLLCRAELKLGLLDNTVYRINWLRARAKKMRWEEESRLLQKEMTWTIAFFHNEAKKWMNMARTSGPGPAAYAERKSDMFTGLAFRSEKCFTACSLKYQTSLPLPHSFNYFNE
jgi:hypothetical protein